MSARPISTATISFGLVSVPVKLYSSAETSKKVSFNLVSKKHGTRLKQQYVTPETGEVVPREEMVKGYEFTKGKFVLFTPEELKTLDEKASHSIDITEFVPFEQVERTYLDKVYYLGPDKGGDRAYKLLSAALKKTGQSAVAKYAARGKQYLVVIRPMDDGLVMEQLFYHDELKPFTEVPLGEAEVKDTELELAIQLISQATSEEFQADKYNDEVRERTLELIQKKIDGEDITQIESEEPKGQIIDLMAALKASLAGSKDLGKSTEKKSRKVGGSSA
jgi:DNA end-binding protein Ku